MQLKRYQQESLDSLEQYLRAARLYGSRTAYERVQEARYEGRPYKPHQSLEGLEPVPYVCLRLPTGGGKTLLCAHTIPLAGQHYLEREFPLVLWLVPTTTIKQQTLDTLKNRRHANSRALEDAYGSRFRVFDIADVAHIRPQDIDNYTCVIVTTFASLRVDNTEGRRAYDHSEDFEAHFAKWPAAALASLPALERGESGGLKFSFVNLLHVQRPLVLVDEAHNAKSDLSVELLRRVNPAAIVEYTATPAKNSNVVQSVSAAQLKAEEMIKLPIRFSVHPSWQEAVAQTIQTRARLEQLAAKEPDYLRPLALFQAENKSGQVTVEVLRDWLCQQENISADQIVIATGDQRGLDDINLFDPSCPVRYIITVQALKEGWDCSFAYVLCSVANTRSATAVEQLLGRVLRMPYAKARCVAELNQAYAHVSQQGWPHAVSQMTDQLVNMGFERQEAEEQVYVQPALPINEEEADALQAGAQQPVPPLIVPLSQPVDFRAIEAGLDLVERSRVRIEEREDGWQLHVEGEIDDALLEKVAPLIRDKKDRREWELRAGRAIRQQAAQGGRGSPAERGECFSVPELCLEFQGEVFPMEAEACLGDEGWNPLDEYTPLTREQFSMDERAQCYVADIEGERVQIAYVNQDQQLSLEGIPTEMELPDLVANLARRLYAHVGSEYMAGGSFVGYLQRALRDLLARGDMDMPRLIRSRFILEKVLRERLCMARAAAYKRAFQQCLFGAESGAAAPRVTVDLTQHAFRFPPDYPASQFYEGRRKFSKHYYPAIAKMNAEEELCALAIDALPEVKHWVRNLERQPRHAFSLPTSTDAFYPDFVAKLSDGRTLVVEYKGAHLDNADTQEKESVGKTWAQLSGNIFLMAWKTDKDGRDLAQQLQAAVTR